MYVCVCLWRARGGGRGINELCKAPIIIIGTLCIFVCCTLLYSIRARQPTYDKKKTALLLGTTVELCVCVCANMQGHGLSNQPQITLVVPTDSMGDVLVHTYHLRSFAIRTLLDLW